MTVEPKPVEAPGWVYPEYPHPYPYPRPKNPTLPKEAPKREDIPQRSLF